jgi:hypothetical protein
VLLNWRWGIQRALFHIQNCNGLRIYILISPARSPIGSYFATSHGGTEHGIINSCIEVSSYKNAMFFEKKKASIAYIQRKKFQRKRMGVHQSHVFPIIYSCKQPISIILTIIYNISIILYLSYIYNIMY